MSEEEIFTYPEWVRAPFRQCAARLDEERRFLDLARNGLEAVRLKPSLLKALSHPSIIERVPEARFDDSFVQRLQDDAAWVETEAGQDFPMLHARCSVGVWSILEVFAEDLAVVWFMNRNDPWEREQIQKIKVQLGPWERLHGEQRVRHVVYEIQKAEKADLKGGLEPLNSVLALLNLAPRLSGNAHNALCELRYVRNAIVHRGGRVDQRLLDACLHLRWKVGDPIRIGDALCEWYFTAASDYLMAAQDRVRAVLGGNLLPARDRTGERPE